MSVPCQRCNHANTAGARFCLNCGAMLEQQVAEAGDPMVGKILMGRYRVLNVLGEGGMGKVYRAEQKMGTATRAVAIKTLHPELSGDPQLVARFYRECETVVELHHPNTIDFYDFGDLEDGTLFIVMEYVEGESLANVLARGALDIHKTDKLLIQICGSLHEAHQKGVVHRDLKPENVLLTNRGGQTDYVKVLDFGIAKRSEAEDESQQKLTKQGMVLGTPPYMSPEQFSGQALDARSDIYSLGIMTYEMLTGHLPFEAKTPWEWATKHLTAQPRPLTATPVAAHLPPNKAHAVERALAKNRDERHGSVLEFLQEFTGLHDAQAAWTMATSAGALTPAPPTGANAHHATPPPGAGRPQVGTPGPMVQPYHTPPPGLGSFGVPTPAPTPTPGYGGYPSGQMETASGGGAGKIIALLVIGLFVLGGGAAGGLWWWSQQGADPQAHANVPPVQPPVAPPQVVHGQPMLPTSPLGAGGQPGTPPMVPSTPTNPPVDPTPTGGQQEAGQQEAGQQEAGQQEAGQQEAGQQEAGQQEAPTPRGGPSADDVARARTLLAGGSTALDRNDLDGAIRALAQAQRIVGRSHASLRSLRTQLGAKGSNLIGIELQRGRCPEAQRLFRGLRSVGADRAARQHFSNDWCRAG